MSEYVNSSEQEEWICARCNQALVIGEVQAAYLESGFPVKLLYCPQCKQVFIPERLALGKVAEVEKSLEDK